MDVPVSSGKLQSRVLVEGHSGSQVSGGCPSELRGAPEPRASSKLFSDLRCPVDVPVSSGKLRSRVLVEGHSGIWGVGHWGDGLWGVALAPPS